MGQRDRFEIDYSDIPFIFETSFGNQDVYIGLNYNDVGKFYTVDLYDNQFKPIIMGEVLVYGKRLWSQSTDSRVPAIDLVPLDESGKETTITPENFGVTVFLCVDEPENAGSEDDVGEGSI